MSVQKNLFGKLNGENVYEYTVSRGDLSVKILNFGGIVRAFNVKTQSGEHDIVLGYNTAEEYEADFSECCGAILRKW